MSRKIKLIRETNHNKNQQNDINISQLTKNHTQQKESDRYKISTRMSQHYQLQDAVLLPKQLSQHNEIPIDELSGDQGMQKTIMVTLKNRSKAMSIDLFETTTTVIKTIVGSGIISLPYTVSVMGWILSIILFSLVGLANHYTCVVLIKAKNLSRHSTYNSIAYYLYSSKLCTFALSFLNVFGNIGFVIAMLSILKSSLRKLLLELISQQSPARDEFYTSQTFIAVIVGLCLLPIVLQERVEKLRYFSVIGVFSIVLAIISLFVIFFVEMNDREWNNNFTMLAFPIDGLAVLSVFPNIMFALFFQSNFFSIYKGLQNATDKRMNVVTVSGIGFSTVLYIVLGIMGYCLFGRQQSYLNANFLLQVNKQTTNSFLYVCLYIGFLVSDLFCIPLTFMVARNNLIVIIKLIKLPQNTIKQQSERKQRSAVEEIGSFLTGQSEEEIKKKAKIRFYIYTTTLFAIYVFITIMVTSLAAVFNIVGAIASSAICFIVPFWFYVMLIKRNNKPKTVHYFISLSGVILFIPLGILSIISLYV